LPKYTATATATAQAYSKYNPTIPITGAGSASASGDSSLEETIALAQQLALQDAIDAAQYTASVVDQTIEIIIASVPLKDSLKIE
jgi:hypothetical protein